jgi:RNase P subunit RPR2
MAYDENIDYEKEFAKTLKEIRKNKPKKTRQERELEKFNEQLSRSIEKDGLIEPIVICKYGVITGESRMRQIKGLPPFTNELYTKETADRFGFIWKDVEDEEQFWRMKITCGLLRKEGKLRKEVLQLAQRLSSRIPMNEVANYIVKLMDGIVHKRRIYEYLPKEYKTSAQHALPEGMNILQKPETVTFSIRTTRSQKEKFYELCNKKGLQVNDVIKHLIDEWIKKMTSTVTTSEGGTIEQEPEMKELINKSKELVQQHPVEIEHKVKDDYCGVCGKFTRFEWDSFNQQHVCVECKNKELSRVKQTPAKVEIRQVVK